MTAEDNLNTLSVQGLKTTSISCTNITVEEDMVPWYKIDGLSFDAILNEKKSICA